jgi:hypothetical protein
MPIKEKDKGLIRLRNTQYESLQQFLEDVFYRDKNKSLTKAANQLLMKIYERGEFGLRSKNWKGHISEIFECLAPTTEDEDALLVLAKKQLGEKKVKRGEKAYQLMLKEANEGKIKLTDEEKKLLEKICGWNACISSYYSIVNKLRAIGLIEKKKGHYFKSRKFFEQRDQINTMINQFESSIRTSR